MQPQRSSPIVVGGRVYLGVSDGQVGFRNAGVVCLDGRTGRVLWRRPLPGDVQGTVCSDGSSVFGVDCQGGVYALDLDDGSVRWRRDVYEDTGFHETRRYGWRTFRAPVTVQGGALFVSGSSILAAFDTANGSRLWVNYDELNRVPYPVSGLAPLGDLVYFEDEHKTVALNQRTGDVAWTKALKELSGDTARERGATTPLATAEGVYFHHRSHLRKVDAATGRELWSVKKPAGFNYVSTPAVARGTVVLGTANTILAYRAEDGEQLWSFETRSGEAAGLGPHQEMLNGSAPLLVKDHVLVGSDDGRFYALALATGARVWEYNTGTPIKSAPALSGNLVVVSNMAGNVFAFVPE